MSEKPIYKAGTPGNMFEVYHNRVTYVEFGLLLSRKETVIPFRNIATVESGSGLTGWLKISTNDGKTRKWTVGPWGKAVRDAILQAM